MIAHRYLGERGSVKGIIVQRCATLDQRMGPLPIPEVGAGTSLSAAQKALEAVELAPTNGLLALGSYQSSLCSMSMRSCERGNGTSIFISLGGEAGLQHEVCNAF